MVNGTGTTVIVAEPNSEITGNAPAVLRTLQEGVSAALEAAGFQFSQTNANESAMADDHSILVNDVSSQLGVSAIQDEVVSDTSTPLTASVSGLASLFIQMKAQFSMAAVTDTLGNTFYPTYLFPANFYQSEYDSSWQSFQMTPGQNTPWTAGSQSGTITGEMITLPLQRAWWNPWIFSIRGWRFDPATGFGNLSDGGSPPQGLMPMYASALIIARNINSPSDATFVLHEDPDGSFSGVIPEPSVANDPNAMLILGFVCTPLPKSPDPDPSLNWGS